MSSSVRMTRDAQAYLSNCNSNAQRQRQQLLSDIHTRRRSKLCVGNDQWLKWFCEAGGGGSPDEARLDQTPYPFQPH